MTQRRQQSHLCRFTEPMAHRRVSDKTFPISRDNWLHQNLACESQNRYVTSCLQGNAWVHNPSLLGRQQRSQSRAENHHCHRSYGGRAEFNLRRLFLVSPHGTILLRSPWSTDKLPCPLFKLRHRASQRQHLLSLVMRHFAVEDISSEIKRFSVSC